MSIEQAINDLPDDVPSQKLDLYGISAADLKRLVRKLAAAREALETGVALEGCADCGCSPVMHVVHLSHPYRPNFLEVALTALDEME